MKNLSFIILIFCTLVASCQTTKEIKLDCVKIAPFGISDLPRDTLFFMIKRTHSLTNINSAKNVELTYQIVTDVKTISEMASFIEKNDRSKNLTKKNFNEYGCFNISGYDKGSLIISYNLNRSESKKYLQSLINLLVKSNQDIRVIKTLKEQCLAPIDY